MQNDVIKFTELITGHLVELVAYNIKAKSPRPLRIGDRNVLQGVHSVQSNESSILLSDRDSAVKAVIFIGDRPSNDTLALFEALDARCLHIPMRYNFEVMSRKFDTGYIDIDIIKSVTLFTGMNKSGASCLSEF